MASCARESLLDADLAGWPLATAAHRARPPSRSSDLVSTYALHGLHTTGSPYFLVPEPPSVGWLAGGLVTTHSLEQPVQKEKSLRRAQLRPAKRFLLAVNGTVLTLEVRGSTNVYSRVVP